MLSNIVALTAGFAATASAFTCTGNYFSFYNRDGPALSYQRLDPALYPGTESPHLHSFDGGNALAASLSFDQTQDSSCTTARIKPDKSLYWRPSLFWNGNGTGFHRVPEKSSKIYYKFGDGDNWANVTGFPEDFNMIAGNPFKRSDGANPASIRWACHTPTNGGADIYTNGFPTGFTGCNDGFATELTFPSCWNGNKLDPKNPSAHMAYPNGSSGIGIENCPTTHRAARFPTIFIEFWYDIASFNGQYSASDNPWVLSNGDSTGFGFHGDFLNGWAKGVLEKATAQTGGCNCGCGCGQTEMETCFGSENVNKDGEATFKNCAASAAYGGDDATVLQTLPGCNPIQSGPADATVATGPDCTATAVPVTGGSKSSVDSSVIAVQTSAPIVSAVVDSAESSQKASRSIKVRSSSSKVVKADNTASASLLSINLPNKHVDNTATGDYGATLPSLTIAMPKDATKSTPFASSEYEAPADDLPAMSLASTPVPASHTGAPATHFGTGEECKAPVYITVTPTVYVTAGSTTNTTSCDFGTIYQTITQKVTITVPAGSVESGSY